ncbi:MAG: sodium:proton antiporter [Candidatus Dormibacter sp.]
MLESGVAAFVVLLMVAAAVAVLVKLIPVPYVTALALVGAAAGSVLHASPTLHLTRPLILFVLLPGLLFEAAFNLEWRRLRDDAIGIGLLATVGVLITAGLIAVIGHLVLGLALPVAFLLGSILAATDPVAVIAMFRRLGVPDRLATIVESESLVNDGTGVVLFTIALGILLSGRFQPLGAVALFLQLSVGGVAVGLAVGFALSRLTMRVDDPQVEITFTAIAAYGSYLLGEAIHVSGLLAVVAAALVMGNYGRTKGMSERTQLAARSFWDYVAFLLNSLVFLLIGLELPWTSVISRGWAIAAAAAITLLARAISVYGVLGLLHPLNRRLPWRWQHLMVWSGIRGAVAIALALSLGQQASPDFPDLRTLVYGVVLVSITVQGLTIGPLSRRLLKPHGADAGRQPKPSR